MIKLSKVVMLFLFCAAIFHCRLFAQDEKDVALMLKTTGKVELKKQGSAAWSAARKGVRIHSGQVVRTGNEAFAALVFTDDKSQLKIRANSSVTINGKREKEGIAKRISLGFGELWAKVTKQNTALRVETPSGVATVKGTEFNALYLNAIFFVYCQQGLIEVFNQFGSLLLGANEIAKLVQGQAPEHYEGNPNDLFNLGDDEGGNKLEIEFEDEQGNKKKLIIEY
jgi:ferric-dicitrate binding protein FerR (iron transport regulator)